MKKDLKSPQEQTENASKLSKYLTVVGNRWQLQSIQKALQVVIP